MPLKSLLNISTKLPRTFRALFSSQLKREPTRLNTTLSSNHSDVHHTPQTKPILRKAARVAVRATLGTAAVGTAGILINRWYRLKNDTVPNPDKSPLRDYLQQQHSLGNDTAPPWVTNDPIALDLLQYCPEIQLPDPKSMQRLTNTVALKSLNECPYKDDETKPITIVVGGPPAVMVAIQKAIDDEPVLYVNYTKDTRSISEGSALHGEDQFYADGPAYTSGSTPLKFFKDEAVAFAFPPRLNKEVLQPNLRWKKLGKKEWLDEPSQWYEGSQVAFGNQQLAWQYEDAKKAGKSTGHEGIVEEIHRGGQYIKALDKHLGGGVLIHPGRDSLLVTRTDADEKDAESAAKAAKEEGCELIKLTPQQTKEEFGFVPQNAKGFWRKVGDFSFRKDFMKNAAKVIAERGGEVHEDWQLRTIYSDANKEGGWMEFVEKTPNGEKIHARKFSNAYTSLGATTYSNSPAPLASVGGASCQAMIIGIELKAGKSIVLGDSNHLSPLGNTRNGPIDPKTGKALRITPVQYTNHALVLPRTIKGFAFDVAFVLHLDESVRTSLPEGSRHIPVSAIECYRQMGPEGILTWHQLSKNLWVQMGAGGASLTQSGRMAYKIAKDPSNPFNAKSQTNNSNTTEQSDQTATIKPMGP